MEVLLSKQEANYIKKYKKCLGSGVDGSVYDMGNHILFKFYHQMGDFILIPEGKKYDSDGVNITNIKDLRHIGIRENHKPINYIDEDGVILNRETAIKRAMQKQKYVRFTTLPQKIIKVDDKLAGCVYKKYDSIFGIYAASFLPLKTRKKILERLYFKLKELLNYNIYPVTLAQKNELFPFSTNNSNILLCKNMDPVIIDVDGISAFYTDTFSKAKYNQAMGSFSKLLLEVLSGIDIPEEDELVEETINHLIDRKIDKDIVEKYFSYGRIENKDIRHLLSR